MIMTTSSEIERGQRLAAQLAPELVGKIEIIENDPDWPTPPGIGGYAATAPVAHLRDEIRRRGWGDRWPQVIVLLPDITPGLIVHELAHCLPAREPFAIKEVTAGEINLERELLTRWAASTPKPPAPWLNHEAPFIRRVCHLAHRAWQAGIEIPIDDLQFAGPVYGLSDCREYALALGREPIDMLGASFTEIERQPMPPKFSELFARDIARHNLT